LKSVYNVEDAVDALASYKGYMIEVSVAQGEHDNDPGRRALRRILSATETLTRVPVTADAGGVSSRMAS
jgi:hypothetical protein